jgi:hypothetical protein
MQETVLRPEQRFWLHNGMIVENLHQLAEAFDTIDDKTFDHHLNEDKNDFYNWIRYALHDKELADDFITVKTKEEARAIIHKRRYPAQDVQKKEADAQKSGGNEAEGMDYTIDKKRSRFKECPHYSFMLCGLKDFFLGLLIGIFATAIILNLS